MINADELVKLVINQGFAIAVAVYVLLRLELKMDRVIEELAALRETIARLG